MSLTHNHMTWKRWWSWVGLGVFASLLGSLVALWIFAALTDHIFRTWFQSVAFGGSNRRMLEYAILLLSGCGAGVVIGLSTAIAFRHTLSRRSLVWWFLASIGGAALVLPGTALILNAIVFTWAPSAAFDYVLFALSALIAGSSLGGMQGVVLRHQMPMALWWLLAVGISWLVLISLFYLLASSLHL